MFGIDYVVGGYAVRRAVDGRRADRGHVFVVADVEVTNRDDDPTTIHAVPAFFVAADGTEHPPVPPEDWLVYGMRLLPQVRHHVRVLFEVPAMLAPGGAVRFIRTEQPAPQRLHLAS
ncbi:hypothetical protein FE697_019740 [Mumia zhuanghuii]|uniref:DUF4352 domain-containing protein n=2 Tax=Mumia TaxID=1546255 RepID=A0ABW1QRF3_9ACTN|nr:MULTISPECIES: hypothetical protein [Mumia]KAA1420110.1 hypothetical protein FE697_019740 [Mumia zhuanghuii]